MSTHEDTAPITYTEALTVTRAMLDAAATVSVLVEYETSGIVRDPSVARILRHVADRFDPPTVPAEPDLTTPEGWIAEAKRCVVATEGVDAFGWTNLPRARGDELHALVDAWRRAIEPHSSALAHNYVRSVQ